YCSQRGCLGFVFAPAKRPRPPRNKPLGLGMVASVATATPSPLPNFISGLSGGPDVPSVLERVADIVAEQLGVDKDKISPETSFVNDLGADSLDTVELVMELEEEFDINIPDDAAEKIQTVGQAVKYIEANSNK